MISSFAKVTLRGLREAPSLPDRQTLMNYLEAALTVLKGSKRPMTVQESMDEASLWSTASDELPPSPHTRGSPWLRLRVR